LPQQFFRELAKPRCANPWTKRVCCIRHMVLKMHSQTRFLLWWKCGLWSSGLWGCLVLSSGSVKIEAIRSSETLVTSLRLHCVTTQKITIHIHKICIFCALNRRKNRTEYPCSFLSPFSININIPV
jgi:hypothetical protein